MIKFSVFYPYVENGKFDLIYYRDKHMNMVKERLGPKCVKVSVDAGIQGLQPNSRPIYVAVGEVFLDIQRVEEFFELFGPHAQEIDGDVPNFTDGTPVAHFSQIKD